MKLKAAWEIALEKHEEYERLTPITEELFDHVAMLEESWDKISPRDPRTDRRDDERPLAA
ncbi:MAG: hypothetical protein J2P44_13945 [Candidatus Dormibacteraeota bacterium]|nr:hypothetical protein [Candidatus Dormibacteraeota bacterium]